MRIGFYFFLIFITSCAYKAPNRNIASVKHIVTNTDIDLSKSLVNIYPATAADNGLWYFFYIQLKNSDGKYVDCSFEDIKLKTDKGHKIDFKLDRVLPGRYYLTIEKTADINSAQLNFYIKNKALREKLKLQMSVPYLLTSKLILLQDFGHKATFRLKLADKLNKPVELPERPEIIIDGAATIEDLRHESEGVWEFTLVYPEENLVLYFSVRALGTYLHNMLRYQHVEK